MKAARKTLGDKRFRVVKGRSSVALWPPKCRTLAAQVSHFPLSRAGQMSQFGRSNVAVVNIVPSFECFDSERFSGKTSIGCLISYGGPSSIGELGA